VGSDDDSAGEETWLLPKQAGDAARCDKYATRPARTSNTFGPWQVGALFGE
jgi:hypothetical protein